uniref:Secreted protein n=1 Tax=Knipowitschia caucasica TaxID=637954 RepID=A0AAV2KWE8_KNICA
MWILRLWVLQILILQLWILQLWVLQLCILQLWILQLWILQLWILPPGARINGRKNDLDLATSPTAATESECLHLSCVYTSVYTSVCTCVYTCVCTCVYTSVCTYVYTCVYTIPTSAPGGLSLTSAPGGLSLTLAPGGLSLIHVYSKCLRIMVSPDLCDGNCPVLNPHLLRGSAECCGRARHETDEPQLHQTPTIGVLFWGREKPCSLFSTGRGPCERVVTYFRLLNEIILCDVPVLCSRVEKGLG